MPCIFLVFSLNFSVKLYDKMINTPTVQLTAKNTNSIQSQIKFEETYAEQRKQNILKQSVGFGNQLQLQIVLISECRFLKICDNT